MKADDDKFAWIENRKIDTRKSDSLVEKVTAEDGEWHVEQEVCGVYTKKYEGHTHIAVTISENKSSSTSVAD